MKRILTIAGSDSGGGAGIQTDLKTITVLGGYGMSVITALTAQNTVGVQAILELPLEFIEKQIDSVVEDIGVDAVKTGMLSSLEIVSLVAAKIKQYQIKCVIVDPVMVAKSGDSLLLPEASVLAGIEVNNLKTMKEAARHIYNLGARNVLVKGGHMKGEIVDLLFDGNAFYEYPTPRIPTKNTHGTGCTFASALATELAKGGTVQTAVERAKSFMTTAIRFSLSLGRGHGPTNPYAIIAREKEYFQVLEDLKAALEKLQKNKIGNLIPEVHSNLGYALPFAEKFEDVAAFPGRITKLNNSIATFSGPEFGSSRHIASIILTLMKHNPNFRSAMNIRFSEKIIQTCKNVGLQVRSFDRADEPLQIKKQEGSSLEWGTQEVLKQGEIPDIIFDRGDVGKEPMVRVIGKNPDEVVKKVLKITQEIKF